MKPSRAKGLDAFCQFYGQIYGARWTELLPALRKSVSHVGIPHCTRSVYHLDAASILPCHALLGAWALRRGPTPPSATSAAASDSESHRDVGRPLIRVLDMCAAPGGKSVIMANLLSRACKETGTQFELTANEVSGNRRVRLARVMEEWAESNRHANGRIRVTGLDASNPEVLARGLRPHSFDFVLLDAPCSSERHLLLDESSEIDVWTPSRTKQNAVRQLQLILSASLFVRPGGRLVYSTCSLSPFENDQIISASIEKIKRNLSRYRLSAVLDETDPVRVVTELPMSPNAETTIDPFQDLYGGINIRDQMKPERTEFGWMVLPDHNDQGWGPMYVSILEFVERKLSN